MSKPDDVAAKVIELLDGLDETEQNVVLKRLADRYEFCTRCKGRCGGWCDYNSEW